MELVRNRILIYIGFIGLVIVAAYQLSILTNNIISSKISKSETLTSADNLTTNIQIKELRIRDNIYKVFNVVKNKQTQKPEPVNIKPIQKIETFNHNNYELIGTITGSSNYSRAYVFDKTKNEVRTLRINDNLDNAELIKINRKDIIFDREGTKLKLDIKGNKNKTALSNNNNNVNFNIGDGDKKVILTRDEVNRRILSNIEAILTTTNIVPYFSNNKMQGIRINKLKKGSILNRVFGIKKNDVILRVNGHILDSMDKALRIWDNVKEENSININLKRNNKIIQLTLEIK